MAEQSSIPRLYEKYRKEVVPALTREFSYGNPMEVPNLVKISLNIGLGEATTNGRLLEVALVELALISGQKPIITKAKKSVANFRLREG